MRMFGLLFLIYIIGFVLIWGTMLGGRGWGWAMLANVVWFMAFVVTMAALPPQY